MALVVEVDEILHHILNRLRGVDGAPSSWDCIPSQAMRCGNTQGTREWEIGLCHLVGGAHQPLHVLRLVQAGVVVPDQLGGVVARPVEDLLPIDGGQPHPVAPREVHHEGAHIRQDVAVQLRDHRRAGRPRKGWPSRVVFPRLNARLRCGLHTTSIP